MHIFWANMGKVFHPMPVTSLLSSLSVHLTVHMSALPPTPPSYPISNIRKSPEADSIMIHQPVLSDFGLSLPNIGFQHAADDQY